MGRFASAREPLVNGRSPNAGREVPLVWERRLDRQGRFTSTRECMANGISPKVGRYRRTVGSGARYKREQSQLRVVLAALNRSSEQGLCKILEFKAGRGQI